MKSRVPVWVICGLFVLGSLPGFGAWLENVNVPESFPLTMASEFGGLWNGVPYDNYTGTGGAFSYSFTVKEDRPEYGEQRNQANFAFG